MPAPSEPNVTSRGYSYRSIWADFRKPPDMNSASEAIAYVTPLANSVNCVTRYSPFGESSALAKAEMASPRPNCTNAAADAAASASEANSRSKPEILSPPMAPRSSAERPNATRIVSGRAFVMSARKFMTCPYRPIIRRTSMVEPCVRSNTMPGKTPRPSALMARRPRMKNSRPVTSLISNSFSFVISPNTVRR